jgi:hypothetical protein
MENKGDFDGCKRDVENYRIKKEQAANANSFNVTTKWLCHFSL